MAADAAVIVETARLRLRAFVPEDLDEMLALLGDPEVMRHYPRPRTREEAAEWIASNVDRYREIGFGLWAVERNDDGAFVGDCGLTVQGVEGTSEVEVGYHVHRRLWRRGYATEAASACRDLAFGRFGVERLVALIRPDNVASQGVARNSFMRLPATSCRGPGGVDPVGFEAGWSA